jgi:hypothetical protein
VKGASTRWKPLSIAVIWSAVTNRNALESVASWPGVDLVDPTATVWLRLSSRAEAGGVRTTIWLNATLTTSPDGAEEDRSGWENPDRRSTPACCRRWSGGHDRRMVGVVDEAVP